MEYPIYWNGKQSGLLRVSHIGEDTCYELSGNQSGLYRAWVEGEQGELLLGIMENGRLKRRFSPHMTQSVGRTVCARLECLSQTSQQWRGIRSGEFSKWQLPSTARCRKNGAYYELALPYEENGCFPLLPLFCFAKIYQKEGKQWAVFVFNEAWEPIMVE
ncbi:MAG: hypothetical protein Q3985_05095 [Eubacteriales bacterium]|nr:hypothetical protein [Eubacteriales bacterium]